MDESDANARASRHEEQPDLAAGVVEPEEPDLSEGLVEPESGPAETPARKSRLASSWRLLLLVTIAVIVLLALGFAIAMRATNGF